MFLSFNSFCIILLLHEHEMTVVSTAHKKHFHYHSMNRWKFIATFYYYYDYVLRVSLIIIVVIFCWRTEKLWEIETAEAKLWDRHHCDANKYNHKFHSFPFSGKFLFMLCLFVQISFRFWYFSRFSQLNVFEKWQNTIFSNYEYTIRYIWLQNVLLIPNQYSVTSFRIKKLIKYASILTILL